MKPIFIPTYIKKFSFKNQETTLLNEVGVAYKKNLFFGTPEISIIIPAYNEAENIVATLASLCNNKINLPTEIIVVNNNSTDKTEELVKLCGVKCITETKQGITEARNAGLREAKGGIILNADADTIYPKNWIQEMTNPLVENKEIAITYGRFSFIPTSKPGRVFYYFYEIMADFTRFYNNFKKDKAVNVYGFNSAFRRLQGLQVDGFNHPAGTNEDGFLALKLSERGFGKIHRVKNTRAIVWTTDRRIQMDGGIVKAIIKRLSRLVH
jgi:glycosyltransferase involved in cell wall biosynthesis